MLAWEQSLESHPIALWPVEEAAAFVRQLDEAKTIIERMQAPYKKHELEHGAVQLKRGYCQKCMEDGETAQAQRSATSANDEQQDDSYGVTGAMAAGMSLGRSLRGV